jgi:GLPGLI family protein
MKKNKLLIKFLFFCVIIFFDNISAQNKLFKYDLEYKPNSLKDSIILEKTILDVKDRSISIFRTEQEKISDSLMAFTGLGLGRKARFEDQFYVKKDISKDEVFKSIQTMFRENFFIKVIEKLDWEILPEKSKIENITVQKAKVNYGGRSWIAWFAIEIPIQEGPYVFKGLPGLIVKISDEKNDYNFSLTEIKNGDDKVYYRSKGSELAWEQFKKLSENYYSDPFARMKPMGIPMKKDDGTGNAVSVNMKEESDKLKKIIRENNNPIELNHKIDYK